MKNSIFSFYFKALNFLYKKSIGILKRLGHLDYSNLNSSTSSSEFSFHLNSGGNEKWFNDIALSFMPESIIRKSARDNDYIFSSFKMEVGFHARLWVYYKNDMTLHPEWMLDDKARAYEFIDHLNVIKPIIYQKGCLLSEIEIIDNTVIKPLGGYLSNGVFIYKNEVFKCVKDSSLLLDYPSFIGYCNNLIQSNVVEDDWIVEELVLDVNNQEALDIKYYCFYGKSPLALIVDRTNYQHSYTWVSRNLQVVTTGKEKFPHYPDSISSYIEEGFAVAEMISKEIPSPFIRIDFLLGKKLVFLEFGNLVGGFGSFNNDWDSLLGSYFSDARRRLYIDMLNNTEFSNYNKFLKSYI